MWEELFQRHHARVALWCLRLTGDRESAADLAQDVFVKAFRSLDSFRGESKFSTWLYAITRNHCFNQVRTRASRPEQADELALAELVDHSPDPLSQLEQEGAAQVVRDMLQQSSLNEVEVQVMTLHYGEEIPIDAVTRLLKLENTSGAKAYVVSAKRKLARAVQRWKAAKLGAHP